MTSSSSSSNNDTFLSIEDQVLECSETASTPTPTSASTSFSDPYSRASSRQTLLRLGSSPIHLPPTIREDDQVSGFEEGAPAEKGKKKRRRSVLLVVVDKAVAIDNRVFSVALIAVFALFFLAIVTSIFMLSVYIWLT